MALMTGKRKMKTAQNHSWRRTASTSIQIWNAKPISSQGCRRYRSRSNGLSRANIAPFRSAIIRWHSNPDGQSGGFVFQRAGKNIGSPLAQDRELVAISSRIVRGEAVAGKAEDAIGEKPFDIHEAAHSKWLAASHGIPNADVRMHNQVRAF